MITIQWSDPDKIHEAFACDREAAWYIAYCIMKENEDRFHNSQMWIELTEKGVPLNIKSGAILDYLDDGFDSRMPLGKVDQ